MALKIDRGVLGDPSWWQWAVTIPFIGAYLLGYGWAIWPPILACVAMGAYCFCLTRKWRPYSVQLRVAYFALLLFGLIPNMRWVHWVQLFGTFAMVSLGYCLLARCLNLLPWNRGEPLTMGLLYRNLVREPCAGGLVTWNSESTSVGSCSVSKSSAALTCRIPSVNDSGEFPVPAP